MPEVLNSQIGQAALVADFVLILVFFELIDDELLQIEGVADLHVQAKLGVQLLLLVEAQLERLKKMARHRSFGHWSVGLIYVWLVEWTVVVLDPKPFQFVFYQLVLSIVRIDAAVHQALLKRILKHALFVWNRHNVLTVDGVWVRNCGHVRWFGGVAVSHIGSLLHLV